MASDDWERHKATILNAFLLQKTPLHEVVSYMQHEHNFVKKKSQYEYQLKKWGIKKKMPKEVWRYVGHKIRKRKGKRSEITLFGVPLSEEKVHKETQRYMAIPTANEFGEGLPSPKLPEGIIIGVQTPSIIEPDVLWPSTLPWFHFRDIVLPMLHRPSTLLKAFFASFGSNNPLHQYQSSSSIASLYRISSSPSRLHKAVLHLTNTIPDDHIDRHQKAKALAKRNFSLSMATEILKVVFFRLSNNMDQYSTKEDTRAHDQFVLHLVAAISQSNPEMFSSLLSGHCVTTAAIKEAVYRSAIREKKYAIVLQLLKSGVDPNLRLPESYREINCYCRRGMIDLSYRLNKWGLSGMDEAAFTCDTRLGEMLLRAGADANGSGVWSPLDIISLASTHDGVHDDSMDFARLLIEHGAVVNSPASRCQHMRSPLIFAISRHNNRLAKFLIEKGASTDLSERSGLQQCSEECSYIETYELLGISNMPLHVAIVSGNIEMIETLFQSTIPRLTEASFHVAKQLLITSCLAGDMAIASKLLELDIALINGAWTKWINPLTATAWNPDNKIAEMLLELGASVGPTQKDNVLYTSTPAPIHIAAYHGNTDLVRHLVNYNADCNVLYKPDRDVFNFEFYELLPSRRSSPLQLALESKNVDTVNLLLPRTNMLGGELALAIHLGESTLIYDIISRGANVSFADRKGSTALEAASTTSNAEMISLYFSSGGTYRTKALYYATISALRSKDLTIIRLLAGYRPFQVIDSYEASSLVISVQAGEWDLVRLLLSDKFLPGPIQSFHKVRHDLERQDLYYCEEEYFGCFPNNSGRGLTPLFAAFLFGDTSVVEAVAQRGYSLLQCDLIDCLPTCKFSSTMRSAILSKFPPESMDLSCQRELLRQAVCLGVREYIKLLDTFKLNSSPSKESDIVCSSTFLGIAACFGHEELVRLFLDAGAHVNYHECGPTALMNAVSKGYLNIVELLLDAGADAEDRYYSGRTAIEEAAFRGHLDIVELLLARGARVNSRENSYYGTTPLQYSAIGGHLSIARLLIERGADIDASPDGEFGRTALEGAAEHGRLDMVQLLLEKGAKLEGSMRIHYVRSVSFAIKNGHYAIANHLKECGSWGDRDQVEYDRLISLDKRFIQFYKGKADESEADESEADESEADESEDNSGEMLTACHEASRTWRNTMPLTSIDPMDLGSNNENAISYTLNSPLKVTDNRVIAELDDTIEGYTAQQATLSDPLGMDCDVLTVATGHNGTDKSTTNGHAVGQLDLWGEMGITGDGILDSGSNKPMLEMDNMDWQSMLDDRVEMEWEGHLSSADKINDMKEIL
ncbi:ankyrin repeat-containing domain protein [Xylariaceae sp. FL1651]|nr:ankyrin repeat-containing domain protein [Xylariaceae sp. FL1651]